MNPSNRIESKFSSNWIDTIRFIKLDHYKTQVHKEFCKISSIWLIEWIDHNRINFRKKFGSKIYKIKFQTIKFDMWIRYITIKLIFHVSQNISQIENRLIEKNKTIDR